MSLLNEAIQFAPELIKHRRTIHNIAEVSDDLPKTKAYVKSELEKLGLKPLELSKSSLVVNIKGDHPGKVFMLRADMDALPMPEDNDLDFKCTSGNNHACGHDFHTTMLLGAAKLLVNNKDKIHGTVKLMFQEAEETLIGAKAMIEDGLLENPKVDAAMMIHVFSGLPVPTGVVFYMAEGTASASSDWYDITIQGKGGHGANPHSAVDPLIAMSNIHLAINDFVAREVSSNEFLVITPCVLQGGTIGNVIPDTAFMQGTIRTYDKKVRDLAKKRIVEIAEGIGKAYRCKVSVKLYRGCPSLINNKEVRDVTVEAAKEIVGKQGVLDASQFPEAGGGKMAGSEDFAYISELVPSTMFGLAANKLHADGNSYSAHHPKVMFDENALPVGSAVYANGALKWLENNK